MQSRTTFQLAMLFMGLIIWGYGQRVDDPSLRTVGIAFFAVAVIPRFFRRSTTRHEADPADDDEGDGTA